MEWFKKFFAVTGLLAALTLGTGFVVGCDDGNDVGDAIDDAADGAKDAADDAADAAKDAADDAGDAIKDATE